MNGDAPLGSFEEQVMVTVLRTMPAAYGMSVRRELERVTGRDVSIGAVYVTLDRLEAKDLLVSSRGNEEGARRIFNVTPRGVHALAESRTMRDRLWHGIDLGRLLPKGGLRGR